MVGSRHVLFGAGQVGDHLARRLLAAGHSVRIVKRTPQNLPPGAEAMPGDAADPEFCRRATEGAATVYHCMNPPYSTRIWAELLPRYMENLIQAAGRAGARLVVLDNVYMLGRPNGRMLDEETPMSPCSRKGEVRARVAARLFEAHARGEVRAVSARASDFYGPGGTQTYLGDPFWKPVLAGKKIWAPVDPDSVHTYHYIPDVAAGLMELGLAGDDVYGRPWMLPCQPAESMTTLVGRMSRHLGREIRTTRIPAWMMGAIGAFVPLVRELNEMSYQWAEPFVVVDRRFRAQFGLVPADREEAAAATVAWAKRHYAARV